MKKIIEMAGVALPGAVNLPIVARTPEGRAMAHIPGWQVLVDPAYREGQQLRNRVLPRTLAGRSGSLTVGSFPNSVPAVDTSAAEYRAVNLPAINPDAWSIFTVMRAGAQAGSEYGVARSVADAPEGGLSLRISMVNTPARTTIYTGTSTGRLSHTFTQTFIGRTVFMLYTFSTRDGLRIFENGNQVAAAPDDKRPLTQGFGANEWQMWRGNRGLIGMSGMLSIDLGWAEHRAYRRQMAEFFATKYGII